MNHQVLDVMSQADMSDNKGGKAYREMIDRIEQYIQNGQLDIALQQIIDCADRWVTTEALIGKLYSAPELDHLAQRIGAQVFSQLKQPDEFSLSKHHVVYLATQVHLLGGHSKAIADLIRAQPDKQHTILLTDLFGHDQGTERQLQFYRELGAQTFWVDGSSPFEKLCYLLRWLMLKCPGSVFLFNHHQDAVIVASVIAELPSRFMYYHHADHHLALGVHLQHCLHIDPSRYGYWHCRDCLGITDNAYLPLIIEDHECIKDPETLLDEGQLKTASSGTYNKFSLDYHHNYFAMLPELIRASGGVHVHYGPVPKKVLDELNQQLTALGIAQDRFIHRHWVEGLWKAFLDDDVDLYISSFPVAGGRAAMEAMGAGLPIVFHERQEEVFMGGRFLGYAEAPYWSEPEELYQLLRSVQPETLAQLAKRSRQHYVENYHPDLLSQALATWPLDTTEPPRLDFDLPPPLTVADCDAYLTEADTAREISITLPKNTDPYQVWQDKNALQPVDLAIFNERHEQWQHQPGFHILVHLKHDQQPLLATTLDSLAAQYYDRWQLWVLADFACPDSLFEQLEPLHWLQIVNGNDVLSTVNQYLDAFSGWVLWLEPGAQLAPQFLNICGDYINQYPLWRLIYTDEDHLKADGQRSQPQFKPDFNLELLRSTDFIGHSVLIQRDALLEVNGFADTGPARLYDVVLRVHDVFGADAIGHISQPLLHRPYLTEEQNRERQIQFEQIGSIALQQHLQRQQIVAEVKPGLLAATFFVDYALTAQPLVSIIIPTKDRLDLLKPCVESMLSKTQYRPIEILIVDNNSSDSQTLAYLAELQDSPAPVRIISYPHAYNFSTINNVAAQAAQGEYLVLLNNDTVVLQPQWLQRMLALGLQDDVGIVGCRLVFPDQKLQHAGVVLGMGGVAEHIHIGMTLNAPGLMQRAQLTQEFSAVTAACLLISKALYFEVEGLDEERFEVLYNDVDLCLKVSQRGQRIVWTPYVTLMHHGSSSIKTITDPKKLTRMERARAHMYECWLPQLAQDPAFNSNLSLRYRDGRPETEVGACWDEHFKDRPRIVAYPCNDFGTGNYRVRAPLRALSASALVQHALMPDHDATVFRALTPVELQRLQADTVIVQNIFHDPHIEFLQQIKRYNPDVLRVFGQDDVTFQAPQKNAFNRKRPKDLKRRLRQSIGLCDRLVVVNDAMAEAFRNMHEDIRIVPNYLENSVWEGLQSQRRCSSKLRVGWAGGSSHLGDLELIVSVVEATLDEFDWVFFGLCPPALEGRVTEIHNGVGFHDYPAKLASLNLDIAIAPLEHNRFNAAKSNLRILEYGILGWPVICTDIEPYRAHQPPVRYAANNTQAWIKAIREYADDIDAAAAEGDRLRQWVIDGWMLDDHVDQWLSVLLPN